jgi:hypothetical protein
MYMMTAKKAGAIVLRVPFDTAEEAQAEVHRLVGLDSVRDTKGYDSTVVVDGKPAVAGAWEYSVTEEYCPDECQGVGCNTVSTVYVDGGRDHQYCEYASLGGKRHPFAGQTVRWPLEGVDAERWAAFHAGIDWANA